MADVPETLTVRNYTSQEVPATAELLKIYPNLAGYHPALEKGGIEFMLGFGFCICSIAPFLFMGTVIFFLIRLRNIGTNISTVTYKMEVMLFRYV
uniref:Uncharacterized protein n=1 Tax=Panagrolaimus superbus TaxID=310955 RepID=A0A914ZBW1_9BILA